MGLTRSDRNTLAVKQLNALGYRMPEIRKALHRLTGITQPDMAKLFDVSRGTITAVIDGRVRNSKYQEAISALWGIPIEDLFPEARKRESECEEPYP